AQSCQTIFPGLSDNRVTVSLKGASNEPGFASAGPAVAHGSGAVAGTPERVARAIVRAILLRQFLPGQRLTEAELTRRLEVGRSTVREALKLLSASGIVELTRHRGAAIRTLSRADSQALVEVMEVLAGLAARLAARHIDVGDNRKQFAAVARTLRASHAGRQLASVLDERLDLYNVMFRIAGNAELDRVVPLPRAQLFRTQFHRYLDDGDLRAMVSEYRSIAEAILDGDEKRAEQRMRKHVQRTAERTIARLFPVSVDDAR
ncbi:MAG TPA: GntR family transcriptional regulator, partial [Casimicrobiaceae bacterium]|nr:GntR family transcriptional regulator [Casimicrobiaceae bacterium]